jgi:hypothetical protein
MAKSSLAEERADASDGCTDESQRSEAWRGAMPNEASDRAEERAAASDGCTDESQRSEAWRGAMPNEASDRAEERAAASDGALSIESHDGKASAHTLRNYHPGIFVDWARNAARRK